MNAQVLTHHGFVILEDLPRFFVICSDLDLLKSSWLYDYNKNNSKPQTAAMAFGSLVHHLILEPESFEQYY